MNIKVQENDQILNHDYSFLFRLLAQPNLKHTPNPTHVLHTLLIFSLWKTFYALLYIWCLVKLAELPLLKKIHFLQQDQQKLLHMYKYVQLNRVRALLTRATWKHRLVFEAAWVMLWFVSWFCDCAGVKTLPCGQRDKHHAACVLIQTHPHRGVKNFTGARVDSNAYLGVLESYLKEIPASHWQPSPCTTAENKIQTEQLSLILYLYSEKKGKNEKEKVKELWEGSRWKQAPRYWLRKWVKDRSIP